MKIKDLKKGQNLGGLHVRTTSGVEGWWTSQWIKGVWLATVPPETSGSQQVIPVPVEDLKECLEWDIIEDYEGQEKILHICS